MARGGVNKAVVHKARQALLARGEHPSIDAVRIEMGNTGSKTTIHRYLKELDSNHPGHDNPQISVDDELLQLVSHLSQRIQEQGQAHIDEALSRLEARERLMREALAQAERQLEELATQHSRQTTELQQQGSALLVTRDALHAQQTENARLSQACQDLDTRLQDRDAHIRSLEEKHLHARDALEHYRSAVKEQREQEQRRHEGQVQQLQMELRQAQQSAMVRQDEITQLHRDNERLLIEHRVTAKELAALQEQSSKDQAQQLKLSEQVGLIDSERTLLQERLRVAVLESQSRQEALTEHQRNNKNLELQLIKAQASIEALRLAAAVATAPEASPNG